MVIPHILAADGKIILPAFFQGNAELKICNDSRFPDGAVGKLE